MTEFDANLWFCENRGNHTIFQRQQDHHVLPETQWHGDSHKKRCDGWLKGLHKKEKKAKAEEQKKIKAAEKKLKEDEERKKKEQNKKLDETSREAAKR